MLFRFGFVPKTAPQEVYMSVKIKIMNSKPARVPVQIRRPAWQEFLKY